MTGTVTDFHNNLLPRGIPLFASGAITSGTVYTAETLITLAPAGANVSYLIGEIECFTELGGTYGNGIIATSTGKPTSPINENWVQYWDDWKDLAAYTDKEGLQRFDETDTDFIFGSIKIQPMLRLDSSAEETFKITIDGTPTANARFKVKYYKLTTSEV